MRQLNTLTRAARTPEAPECFPPYQVRLCKEGTNHEKQFCQNHCGSRYLIDFSYGWGIWWSWVIASAIFGIIMGLASKRINLADGEFSTKEILTFNVAQVIGHVLAWGLFAPVLDIVMYAEPANKVFVQGLVGGLANIVTTAIIGTLLCVAYAATKPKKGSLKEEK